MHVCVRSELNLAQRMEYLSRATMCAKSSTLRTSTATEGEFLHELEEKMEVLCGTHKVCHSVCRTILGSKFYVLHRGAIFV